MKNLQTAKVVFRYITGTPRRKDSRRLGEMCRKSERLRHTVDSLENPAGLSLDFSLYESFDVESGWERLLAAVKPGMNARGANRPLGKAVMYAASVALLATVSACVLLFGKRGNEDRQYPAEGQCGTPVISQTLSSAIMELEEKGISGGVKTKGSYPSENIMNTGTESLGEAGGGDMKQSLLEAVRVTTFHDKEMWAELPDGSLVHLGFDSKLIYPERFSGKQRDVYLSGDAYFIVAGNPASPFTVYTDACTVRAYGTEFGISAKNTGRCEVELTKGEIGVDVPGMKEILLSPGRGVRVDGKDAGTFISDSEVWKAWNEGRVYFNSWPVSRLLKVIGRWYGKTVAVSGHGPDVTLSGNYDRYDDLIPTLESIRSISGNKIILENDTIKLIK